MTTTDKKGNVRAVPPSVARNRAPEENFRRDTDANEAVRGKLLIVGENSNECV